MGKPRLIILIRHGQSEGNKNRDIHQYIPDHRVKLTPEGWSQAEDAGRRLKKLLRQDDTIRIFTSPYRRTRETTEGILRTLTADDEDHSGPPTPFNREQIKVYEEPRLREQDFGNFQPCSVEMERMWQERSDYGHFFYRIPDGESAADAYDRISGFNESLWRQFGDEDFPSVCVLVTHGLMTRVFLMKWYHWSVEYFEDLRNIHHCEFIVMKQQEDGAKKYVLQTTLRTWSELHKRSNNGQSPPSPQLPARRWGGCANGCNHSSVPFPRRTLRTSTIDIAQAALATAEHEDHPKSATVREDVIKLNAPSRTRSVKRFDSSIILHDYERNGVTGSVIPELSISAAGAAAPNHALSSTPTTSALTHAHSRSSVSESDEGDDDDAVVMSMHRRLRLVGRDGGGSRSGFGTPNDINTDESEDSEDHYFGSGSRRGSTKSHGAAMGAGGGMSSIDAGGKEGTRGRKGSASGAHPNLSVVQEEETTSSSATSRPQSGNAKDHLGKNPNVASGEQAHDKSRGDGLDPDEGTAKGDVY